LGTDAPSLKALMKKPALDLHDDQPITTLKRKQPTLFSKDNFKEDQNNFFQAA
jgi:hypothetical protein